MWARRRWSQPWGSAFEEGDESAPRTHWFETMQCMPAAIAPPPVHRLVLCIELLKAGLRLLWLRRAATAAATAAKTPPAAPDVRCWPPAIRQAWTRARQERRALLRTLQQLRADAHKRFGIGTRCGRHTGRTFLTRHAAAVDHEEQGTRQCLSTLAPDQRLPFDPQILFAHADDRRCVLLAAYLWCDAERRIRAQALEALQRQWQTRASMNATARHWQRCARVLPILRPVLYLLFVPRVPSWCSWLVSLMVDGTAWRARARLAVAGYSTDVGLPIGEREQPLLCPPSPWLWYALRQPVYAWLVEQRLGRYVRRARWTRAPVALVMEVLRASAHYYFYTAAS
ncbi:hypothetical protein CDCA_CDCA20G4859 [Cyanidium caldarium]|uniref:Peroxisomal membrane protein PEX16 n=1 Tax=Cyanidium caldarium TaxID=2771 RepID=A0AAV9J3F4_CYACA|nr:hypothetical protein CDCA_CDCA20G4859 [Cyanidium caldarium]